MMILQFVFVLSCALFTYAQEQSLLFRLTGNYACNFYNMYDSFNSTGMNDKINGSSSTMYTLFAVCDPTVSAQPLTVDQLNYHLAHGEIAFEDLPDDGLLDTDFVGNQIRITKYNGIPFANGQVRLSNTPLNDYYPPEDVINGAFYRVDKNINTNEYGPLIPPINKKILEAIVDYQNASIVAAILSINPYVPPSETSWTFFIPVDDSFNRIPPYQKDLIINGGAGIAHQLLSNHVVNGSHFAAPLKYYSQGQSGTNQTTYDYYMTVSGKNVTMKYNYQSPVCCRYSIENKVLTVADAHYLDGVIHIIPDFLFFDEFSKTLPPPTLPELFEQYSTFPYTLKSFLGFDISLQKNTQVGKFISLVEQSGAVIPDEDITMFFLWDDTITRRSIDSIDPDLVLYLIIKGQYNVEDFAIDELIPTSSNTSSAFIRINEYDGAYYINGVATFIIPNMKLTKATVHIIDSPFLLAPPCDPTDTLCEGQLNWIDTTIAESIKKNSEYSTFVGLLEKISFTPTNPYTLLVVKNEAFTSAGQDGVDLLNYLNNNTEVLENYMRKFYIQGGTWFPNAALEGDITIYAEDENNTEYQLSWISRESATIDSFTATPYVRNDGIYYELIVPFIDELIPFTLPPPPVAPSPLPTAPIPSPVKPCQVTDTCSAPLNGIQIWLTLFFVAVLFLM